MNYTCEFVIKHINRLINTITNQCTPERNLVDGNYSICLTLRFITKSEICSILMLKY